MNKPLYVWYVPKHLCPAGDWEMVLGLGHPRPGGTPLNWMSPFPNFVPYAYNMTGVSFGSISYPLAPPGYKFSADKSDLGDAWEITLRIVSEVDEPLLVAA